MSKDNLLIVIIFSVLILVIYSFWQFVNWVSVKACDDKYYKVRRNSNDSTEEDNADTLARLNRTIERVISALEQSPDHYERNLAARARKRYTSIKESRSEDTYTVAKRNIFICLKTDELNTLKYVALHELSHIVSNDYGHESEFVTNFEIVLRKATRIGEYKTVNYRLYPKKYCAMVIDSY